MAAAALLHPAHTNTSAAAPFGGPIAEEDPGGSLQHQRSGSEGEQLPGQRPSSGGVRQHQGGVAEPEGDLPPQQSSRQGPGAPAPQPAAQRVDAGMQGDAAPSGEQRPAHAAEGADADAAATDKQGGSQSRRSLLDRLLTGPPPPAVQPRGVPITPGTAVPRAASAPSAPTAASGIVRGSAQAIEPPLPSSVGARIHSAPAAPVASDCRATRLSPAAVLHDPPVLQRSASDGAAAANSAASGGDGGGDDDGRDPELASALERALARAAGPSAAGLSGRELPYRGNRSASPSLRPREQTRASPVSMPSCACLLLVSMVFFGMLRKVELIVCSANRAAAAAHGAQETQLFEPVEAPGSRSSARLRCDRSRCWRCRSCCMIRACSLHFVINLLTTCQTTHVLH